MGSDNLRLGKAGYQVIMIFSIILLPMILSSVSMVEDICCRSENISDAGLLSEVFYLPKDVPDDLPTLCEAKCGFEQVEGAEYYCFKNGGWESAECNEGNFRVKRSGRSIHAMSTTTTTTTTTTTPTTTSTTTTTTTNPYCNISTDHTMCKYEGPSASCSSTTVARSFSESGKNLILLNITS